MDFEGEFGTFLIFRFHMVCARSGLKSIYGAYCGGAENYLGEPSYHKAVTESNVCQLGSRSEAAVALGKRDVL